jgi:hypothetical protein
MSFIVFSFSFHKKEYSIILNITLATFMPFDKTRKQKIMAASASISPPPPPPPPPASTDPLAHKIAELKATIKAYEIQLDAAIKARDREEKSELRALITASRNTLNKLLDQQQSKHETFEILLSFK